MKQPRCIVIGAGLAGLSAAHRLTESGWHVTVLEEQHRLGGRVMSYAFPQARGLVCELGAEWIGKSHHRMIGLCREFELRLQRHQYSFCFWDGAQRSRFYRPGAWPFARGRPQSNFKRLRRTFRKIVARGDRLALREMDQTDWWTTLQRLGFSVDQLQLRDLMDSTDFGESIRLSSTYLAATEYLTDGGETDQMDFKIRGGNHQLIDALVAATGSRRVHKSAKVTKIEQSPTGVAVHVTGWPAPREADYCICTVPGHRLADITWRPKLPLEQFNAASQLQYSRIMKTAVLCGSRFWPTFKESGFSVFTGRASDYCFDSSYGQSTRPFGILCSYAIGDKADDLAYEPDPDKVRDWITDDVAHAVGKPVTRTQAIGIQPQAWQREKGIGGAYAFYRPGQWFTVRPILSRPHGRVSFAGEHLSEPWQGFMEGAVETGQTAAARLIKHGF